MERKESDSGSVTQPRRLLGLAGNAATGEYSMAGQGAGEIRRARLG